MSPHTLAGTGLPVARGGAWEVAAACNAAHSQCSRSQEHNLSTLHQGHRHCKLRCLVDTCRSMLS